jgi:excisionase family DNA binding protein
LVSIATLNTVARLEQELTRAGRTADGAALRAVLRAFVRGGGEMLTTGQAARQLGVSIPTVKRWLERGTLEGSAVGGRWLVTQRSVERITGMRAALAALDAEGNPTLDEIRELYERHATPATP